MSEKPSKTSGMIPSKDAKKSPTATSSNNGGGPSGFGSFNTSERDERMRKPPPPGPSDKDKSIGNDAKVHPTGNLLGKQPKDRNLGSSASMNDPQSLTQGSEKTDATDPKDPTTNLTDSVPKAREPPDLSQESVEPFESDVSTIAPTVVAENPDDSQESGTLAKTQVANPSKPPSRVVLSHSSSPNTNSIPSTSPTK